MNKLSLYAVLMLWLVSGATMAAMPSDRIADVVNTKHNFSTESNAAVKAKADIGLDKVPAVTGGNGCSSGLDNRLCETEQPYTRVCVFCHTPHNARVTAIGVPNAPLWNRDFATDNYTFYQSGSMDSVTPTQTHIKSKLCLSCHDGTLAIGGVGVVAGQLNYTFEMLGTDGGKIPAGELGANTGYTANLGTDLSNDHPISIVYDDDLSTKDGALRPPGTTAYIGMRGKGLHPSVPLEPSAIANGVPSGNATVECTTCHDPHITSTDATAGNIKFLRLHRFQKSAPAQGDFDMERDIGCIACHEKSGWVNSAHANPLVADELYSINSIDGSSASPAQINEFLTSPGNALPVWRVSCLNCHDSHTVPGARSLLREAVGGDLISGAKIGGQAAQEEVCLGCHSQDGGVINASLGDIKNAYQQTFRMPLVVTDQSSNVEEHGNFTKAELASNYASEAQLGKDLVEPQANLGLNNDANRHAECTDCHDPHRLRKTMSAFAAAGTVDASGNHPVSGVGAVGTNIISSVLRGSWGVEPDYQGTSFFDLLTEVNFTLKRGDPGDNQNTDAAQPYVTREYQICMKCHSSFAFGNNPPPTTNSGGSTGSLNAFPVGFVSYTDQAVEFQAPAGHKGDVTAQSAGGAADGTLPNDTVNFTTNNHRSWHPVTDVTGRSQASSASFLAPFQTVGNQTMYCSDCHGLQTAAATIEPAGTQTHGPHGSSVPYILKGPWNANTGTNAQDHLCFKCHRYEDYADPTNTAPNTSGFATPDAVTCAPNMANNLHAAHAKCMSDAGASMTCSTCHVAVPHGWKNKALLVNLDDLGPEAGFASKGNSTAVTVYNNPPYYANAKLRVTSFQPSGQWSKASCGAVSGCHAP